MGVLVTGGGGFLGGAIITRLLARGLEVRNLARGSYPELAAKGVRTLQGDLADAEVVSEAMAGCEAVFHVAAKAGMWGRYVDYHRTNVEGTRNIIAAAREHGVAKLVYTSTPSVIQRETDIEGADESLPYPDHHTTHYQRTKAIAEREVLAANDESLATVALRPRMIWGPGDTQITPRLVERSRAGSLRLVGSEPKLVDSVYIDNAADAHLLAFDRLAAGAACAGKAYFITQGDPMPISELMNAILAAAGEPPVVRSVPPWLAYVVGALSELGYTVLGRQDEPRMTRFLARQLCTANWFDISAARRDLGYEPAVSTQEGLERLAAWFSDQRSA